MEQNNNSSKIGVLIAVILVGIGIGVAAYMLTSQPTEQKTSTTQKDSSKSDNSSNPDSTQTSDTNKSTVGSTVITFTNDGFDKSEYTSKAGEAVTVKNASSMNLQFSSDDHPTHRDHPELNEGVLSPGESSTFTPNGKGTFGFHDHIHDDYTGTLTVQ